MFYDDVEPKVLISMPIVEDLAPQTQSHAGRQERVKVELSHSVLPILPSVLGLAVLETKSL